MLDLGKKLVWMFSVCWNLCAFQDGIAYKLENEEKENEKRTEEEEEVAQGEATIYGLSNIPVVCKTEEVTTENLLVEEVSGVAVAYV